MQGLETSTRGRRTTSATAKNKGKEKGEPERSKRRREGFELNSKGLFLTYPQCSVQPAEALELFREIFQKKKRTIQEYVIAQEKHADGNDHLHAFIRLNKALHISNAALLDLKKHHGNYQSARSPTRVKAYCTKEGNYIADPPYQPVQKPTTWADAVACAESGDSATAITILKTSGERACRDLVLHSASIKANLRAFMPPARLSCARELSSYKRLFEWDKTKTLVLSGPTNTGKTTLAASLLPFALFTRHLDRLGELSEGHEGIILDDMSFIHLHDEAQIHLVDTAMESHIHIRYKYVTLPAGLPRIVTTNKAPLSVFNLVNPAIARRVQCIQWDGWGEGWTAL